MENWNTFLVTDEGIITPLGITTSIIGFDPAKGKDETVVSVWEHGACSFSYSQRLSKKEYAKWMWCFGMKTKLPRKMKKQFKNQKLMRL